MVTKLVTSADLAQRHIDEAATEYRPWTGLSTKAGYVCAVFVVIFNTAIAHLMIVFFELSNVVMIYLLGVVIVSVFCGRAPAILTSLLSVAAFDFFFVPPKLTFAVTDTQYIITFAVMLTVALVISTLTAQVQQQARASIMRERRANALYLFSKELTSTLDETSIAETGLQHIQDVFGCTAALFIKDEGVLRIQNASSRSPAIAVDFDEGVAMWVFENAQSAGPGTSTLPGIPSLYVPLVGARQRLGVIAVARAENTKFNSPEQINLLEAFGNQMALAIERAKLSAENERSRLQVRTEQLRSSLLSSVSHDLRTPLATITGAASSILSGTERLDTSSCKALVTEIYDESIRLNKLVSNLLDMTKLQSGNLQIKKQLHPVEEIVGSAISLMEERVANHQIRTDIPAELPFVRVDAILLQQLLVNLIENAVKYTPPGSTIEMSAREADGKVKMIVADNGPGIPTNFHKQVFEMFFRTPKQEQLTGSSFGLGLAICAGIMQAHGGSIQLENRPGGGALFSFELECESTPTKFDAGLEAHNE